MARQVPRRPRGAKSASRPVLAGRKLAAFRLVALLLPFVLLGCVELVLRLAGAGYPTSFFLAVPATGGYTTNPRFGWRFFPPALARTPLVTWIPAEKPAGTFRVFVLGESAAMGVPEPAFGFSRMLEVLLADAYPELKVEMVNAAMTAINSHVIRDIARECARYQPDLFVIYMGNNEVVGPFGPATIFTRAAPRLPLIRARMLADRTRTGQVVRSSLELLGKRSTRFTTWRGMEMLTEQEIASDDPRLATTYRNFRTNLEAILDVTHAADVPVVLSTVAVNLRDSPPFGSHHGRAVTDAEAARWNEAVARGEDLQAAGSHADAVNAYREALTIDDGYAEIHFRLGEALAATGQGRAALDAFARARDFDVLRFRADSGINALIRTVAEHRSGSGQSVVLMDAERLFGDTSGGAPGEDLFWEHVHLNTAGNYLLARGFFAQVAQLLEARGSAARPPPVASFDQVVERLALTESDRLRMASGIVEMTRRPPFTRQFGHTDRMARRAEELAALRAAARAEGDRAERAYRSALAARPHDLQLRASFATLLRERGRFAEAAGEWRALLARVPGVVEWRSQLAFSLADQAAEMMLPREPGSTSEAPIASHGSGLADPARLFAEAESLLRAIVDEQPRLPAAHVNLGNVLERQGRIDAAVEAYETALRLDPGHETARLNLAALAAARGALDESSQLYREAIALDPLSADTHARLGGVLERQQRPNEAIAEYRRALELDPDLPRVRNTLAYALERQGKTASAMDEYRRAIESDPDYTLPRVNLADLLMREDRLAEAARELREARAREPDHPAVLIGLALIHATADDRGLRNPPEAVRLAERAAAVTGGAPEAWRTLAISYAAARRLGDALAAARRGAGAARARGDERLAEMLDEQARRYREAEQAGGLKPGRLP